MIERGFGLAKRMKLLLALAPVFLAMVFSVAIFAGLIAAGRALGILKA